MSSSEDVNTISIADEPQKAGQKSDATDSPSESVPLDPEQQQQQQQNSFSEVKVPLGRTQFILVYVGLLLAIMLAALDQTIVSTALKSIVSDFGHQELIPWIGSAYLLTAAPLGTLYGKFADIFGRKAVFLFAILSFEFGSLLCGVSVSMEMLIVGRAVAGVGGGGIFALVLIIISDIVSMQDRGRYQGLIGAVFGLSSVIGPLIGGAFSDHVSWRMSKIGVARTVFLGYTVSFSVAAFGYFRYTQRVRSITRLEDTPAGFQASVQGFMVERSKQQRDWLSAAAVTWGCYMIEYGSSVSNSSRSNTTVALNEFTRRMFGCTWYGLERWATEISEDANSICTRVGERYGRLRCDAINNINNNNNNNRNGQKNHDDAPNEALWRYVDSSLDFALFVGTYENCAVLGFVELKGDVLEDLGSRVLLPLLLTSAISVMRRTGGISGIQAAALSKARFDRKGDELSAERVAQLTAQLGVFKQQLTAFAAAHSADIRRDPRFRARFHSMCAAIGGFWAELLGVSDFYYELAVQIAGTINTYHISILLKRTDVRNIEICIATRDRNGGLIEFSELKRLLDLSRIANSQQISDDDIIQAINSIACLGNGFEIVSYGSHKLVQSIPRELNKDYDIVLALAQHDSFVTFDSVTQNLGWDPSRVHSVLTKLQQDGICWIDSQASPPQYWVVSFFSV
ncbi:Vacuolar protein sorting-associated protein SNF8 [Physocladia obscura]|uniref:Vacuolar protein sorting-associated protein SNF8 n=1 Tax=Physocladia obscura TaxID=109957 RepID=A0AAD5T048_9FUNG|nr:Vacuolar protein sorting-associated protein SNF8 [Physocladia obscura]